MPFCIIIIIKQLDSHPVTLTIQMARMTAVVFLSHRCRIEKMTKQLSTSQPSTMGRASGKNQRYITRELPRSYEYLAYEQSLLRQNFEEHYSFDRIRIRVCFGRNLVPDRFATQPKKDPLAPFLLWESTPSHSSRIPAWALMKHRRPDLNLRTASIKIQQDRIMT